jgi:hypothetical protein
MGRVSKCKKLVFKMQAAAWGCHGPAGREAGKIVTSGQEIVGYI